MMSSQFVQYRQNQSNDGEDDEAVQIKFEFQITK